VFKVTIKKDALKTLKKIPAGIREKIEDKIEKLRTSPHAVGESMQGFDNRYKFRQGQWRVIYEIWDDELVVEVIKVGARGDVYKH